MNYKILMVDDDRELLKMLNQYFTLKNYTVMIAENGIEAMEKISANPDIILLDVNMPGMDGIEVCRRIRDMVSCPIIFLTAKVEEQDRVIDCCFLCRYLCAGNYKQPFRSSETVSDKKENLFYYTETDDTGNFFAAARCSWIWIVFCVSETNYTSSNRK